MEFAGCTQNPGPWFVWGNGVIWMSLFTNNGLELRASCHHVWGRVRPPAGSCLKDGTFSFPVSIHSEPIASQASHVTDGAGDVHTSGISVQLRLRQSYCPHPVMGICRTKVRCPEGVLERGSRGDLGVLREGDRRFGGDKGEIENVGGHLFLTQGPGWARGLR